MTVNARGVSVAGRLAQAHCRFEAGTVTAICGPNGAGKSTLLAVLAGLLEPDTGEVLLDDEALLQMPRRERAQRIGYLPQAREVAWDIDVATLTRLGRLPWRSSGAEDEAAVERALAAVDLADLGARPVSTLSGGERARALLARVLAGEPRWLLADEPLEALDLGHQAAIMRHLGKLAADGLGVVAVLHDLAWARNRADRVILLDRGRVVAAGPPDAVLTSSQLAATWGVAAEWVQGADGFALIATGPATRAGGLSSNQR